MGGFAILKHFDSLIFQVFWIRTTALWSFSMTWLWTRRTSCHWTPSTPWEKWSIHCIRKRRNWRDRRRRDDSAFTEAGKDLRDYVFVYVFAQLTSQVISPFYITFSEVRMTRTSWGFCICGMTFFGLTNRPRIVVFWAFELNNCFAQIKFSSRIILKFLLLVTRVPDFLQLIFRSIWFWEILCRKCRKRRLVKGKRRRSSVFGKRIFEARFGHWAINHVIALW